MSEDYERKKRRVAVIVFGEVESSDDGDAEAGLMLAVRQTLAGPRMGLPATLTARGASGEFEATIGDVIGMRYATGNSYLKLVPTRNAYHWVEAAEREAEG